jgi:hypothetical protein
MHKGTPIVISPYLLILLYFSPLREKKVFRNHNGDDNYARPACFDTSDQCDQIGRNFTKKPQIFPNKTKINT